jgi:hypothetical protein
VIFTKCLCVCAEKKWVLWKGDAGGCGESLYVYLCMYVREDDVENRVKKDQEQPTHGNKV